MKPPPPDNDLLALDDKIGYRFANRDFIEEAMRHSSFVNEISSPVSSNERLEFLGDAVLNLCVSHMLLHRFPKSPEGDLTRARAALVNESQLALIAEDIDLGHFLKLGRGERRSDGHRKRSILANTYEAMLAAVYLDGGFSAAFDLVHRHMASLMNLHHPLDITNDFKSRLQEWSQNLDQGAPTYRVIDESGPDHDKTFQVEVKVASITATGLGKNKKTAEQNAAKEALCELNRTDPDQNPQP